jgi:hypothetical protein
MKLIFLLSYILYSTLTFAYETDQFTTPKAPLADVGEDLSAHITKQISIIITDLNNKDALDEKIKILNSKLALTDPNDFEFDSSNNSQRSTLTRQLKILNPKKEATKTTAGIVNIIADEIGGSFTWQDQLDGVFGLPLSIFPNKHNLKNNEPITYIPSRLNTIYSFSGFHRLISSSYFVFCSTMRAYDIYFGVDKLGHFFNQGHDYYKIYQQTQLEKLPISEAYKRMENLGIESENKWFGLMVDGVYSNGDLAANMAGFHFYKNLFEEITLNNISYAPLLLINDDGKIIFNPIYDGKENDFLKKFFTWHLNEAFNPSYIEKLQRPIVRHSIKKRCENFKQFYNIDNYNDLKTKIDSMKLWNNISYGHRGDNLLRVDEICF